MRSYNFASEHIPKVFSGRKNSTIRLSSVTDKPEENDRVLLCNTSGEAFMEVQVINVQETRMCNLPGLNIPGHEDYDSLAQLLNDFRGYYPSETITPKSEVFAFWWDEKNIIRKDI